MTLRSEPGRVRPGNQDAVYSGVDPAGKRGCLLVVADGMGGENAGEVASRIAVDSVVSAYFNSSEPPCTALRAAFLEANRSVLRASQTPEKSRMGTTCSALALLDDYACIAHVGDSRIYRLRRGCFERLTRAHSLWAEQVERGVLSPAARAGQNVLTRVIGGPDDLEVDIVDRIDLRDGDRFLLCSDGLWGLVTDPEIAAYMQAEDEESCGRLVCLANERGGPDNVSAILARVSE